jgi:hypothetical protein
MEYNINQGRIQGGGSRGGAPGARIVVHNETGNRKSLKKEVKVQSK